MGYASKAFQIVALLDEYGGEKEKRDEKLWEELTTRLAEIAREDKYEGIVCTISNDEQ